MKERSSIYAILIDEYDRVQKQLDFYESKISSLPKGSVKIVRNRYVYLCVRENGKPVNKYLGILSKVQPQLKLIERRRYYESQLKRCRWEKMEIESYLKVGERLYGKHGV